MTIANYPMISEINIVLVVNKEFEIIYNSRSDERMNEVYDEFMGYKNFKNFFDLYPSLSRNKSSLVKAISTGEVVYNETQEFEDLNGNIYVTQNITLPMFQHGKIVGAVELSKILTTPKNIEMKSLTDDDMSTRFDNRDDRERITFDDILTVNKEMKRAVEQARLYSQNMNPTLIYGETGTGKELFAQAMIEYSITPKKRIFVQNCAALPENLIESILFGTTKGSYTGAENRKGLFEEANGGILFLDELSAMPYNVQSKLLRVIQDGTFRPIGSNSEKKTNVKIIAAMNVDPVESVEAKILRKDLFYRLSNGMIFLPPLRCRKDDIEFFTKYYIDEFNRVYGKNIEGISDDLRKLFMEYEWDGNVRELKHVIETMATMTSDTVLSISDIPLYMHNKIKNLEELSGVPDDGNEARAMDETSADFSKMIIDDIIEAGDYDLNSALKIMEKEYILRTLEKTNGNKTKAGEILKIPRQTLKYRMGRLGIEPDDSPAPRDKPER